MVEKYCPRCKATIKMWPADEYQRVLGYGWYCPSSDGGCGRPYRSKELDDAFCTFIKRDVPNDIKIERVLTPEELIALKTLGATSPKAEAQKGLTLPIDSEERKGYPLFRGCLRYFSAALAGVSRISKIGNDKHNPGEDMHHARGKSMDHGDCIVRHLMDVADLLAARERGTEITHEQNEQILTEASQLCWRALAFSQELHERLGAAPLAPGARLTK